MSYDPVEGVHYIFDRYAFLSSVMKDGGQNLSLSPESPAPKIEKAIKLARAMYHPDRQERAGEKMKLEAERMSKLIDDCERFLSNNEIRKLYDDRLASFRKDKPKMVSENGSAIINISEMAVDIDSLLADDVADTREMEQRIKELTQYDEKRVPQIKSLYDTMPDNPQIKTLYRDALTQKLMYIILLENVAWTKIGVHNRWDKTDSNVMSSDEYVSKVEEALQNFADHEIDRQLEQHGYAMQIGMSTPPLLLGFNNAATGTAVMNPADITAIKDKMKVRAKENFTVRADYVREIAQKKQDVLEILATLTPVTALNDHNMDDPIYDFYLVDGEDIGGKVLFCLTLNAETAKGETKDLPADDLTIDTLKALPLTRNSFMVERNREITDFLIEMSAAMDRVATAFRNRPKPSNQPIPPAPPMKGF